MKPQRAEAIILHTLPARERDKLVVFLTADRGKRKGWAYGARSLKSRYGAALEPLAKVRLTWYERETEEVVRIDSVELVRSLFPAQQDLVASIAASYLAETADVFAQQEEESELLYRLLDSCCEALLNGIPPETVVAYIEVWSMKIAGLFPSVRVCIACGEPLALPLRYDRALTGFVCSVCATGGSGTFANETSVLLGTILSKPVDRIPREQASGEALFDLRAFVRVLRREFLGHELRSHDILQVVLSRDK